MIDTLTSNSTDTSEIEANVEPPTSNLQPSTSNLQPSTDIAISVRNVSKMYPLYAKPGDRLKQSLWYALPKFLRGQPRQFYREFWALHDVSFEVKRGEALGIIGRNGSGKSTLLQIIAGTLAPTAGEVTVNGRVAALLELGSGFNPDFTGRENVYLNGSILGFSREEMDNLFDEIAAFADIGQFMDQPVKLYSSGMFVRLAFAVQACVKPDVLIVDEALAVGDAQFQQRCYRRIDKMKDDGVTILYVTHDVWTVANICHHCLLLNQGELIDYGMPKEVVDVYNAITAEKIAAEMRGEQFRDARQIAAKRVEGQSQVYGTGEAKILDVQFLDSKGYPVGAVESNEWATIRVRCSYLKDIDNSLVGITIRNGVGVEVYMTCTLWKGIDLGYRKAGDICVVDFVQKMCLVAGQYFINISISQNTPAGIKRLHWISDLIQFKVFSLETIGGIANMDSEISVSIDSFKTSLNEEY